MFKKIIMLATLPLSSYADATPPDNALFQKIDSVISVGTTYTSGSINGNNYTVNGLGLMASKLFDNNVWVNLSADTAFNTSMSNGSASFLNADVGYAWQFGNVFQVIPNIQLQRMQVANSSLSSNANVTVYDELADVHMELIIVKKRMLLFGDLGYGIGQFNATSNTAGSSSNTDTPSTSSGAVTQGNIGIAYHPVANVPWMFKGQYIYRSYNNTANFGATNGYMLSTGISF